MAKNIDFMGATFPDVPSIRLPQHEGGLVSFDDTTDATATADKILSGYTAYANGQKLVGTASGGITPSGTISITQNGTVDVTQYASADVNVSGGGGSGIGTLLVEESIGHVQTTSTSYVLVWSKTIDNWRDYPVLFAIVEADTPTTGHLVSTFSTAYLGGSYINSPSSSTPVLTRWIAKQTSPTSISVSADAYGVFISSIAVTTGTVKVSARYNSSYTGTIDDDYTIRLYGLKLDDLT